MKKLYLVLIVTLLLIGLTNCQLLSGSSLGGGDPNAYYDRGIALARRGDKQAAIRTLQQAADLYRSQGNESRYQETVALIRQMQR